MKKILFIVIFIIQFMFAFSQEVSVPQLNKRVTDLTSTLTSSEIEILENMLKYFEDSVKSQVVVLIISTTGDETIEEYSIKVAEEWKIGREGYDDGVILLVAKDDRKVRIEVGYGLEAIITDAEAKLIIENYIVPEFRNGNFYSGIYSGLSQITYLIEGGEIEISNNYYTYVDEEEEEILYYYERKPGLAYLLLVSTFILPVFFFFMGKMKFIFVIIAIIILLGLDLLAGLAFGGFMGAFPSILNTVIFGAVGIVLNLTLKKGGDFFTSSGSNYNSGSSSYNYSSGSSYNYGSSSSSYNSSNSTYSGGGGNFGGGGASGSW